MSRPQRYNVAPQKRSVQEQALAVEDSEVKILELCKDTALLGYTRERFVREVNRIIAEAQKSIDNEQLKRRIVEPLQRYAARTLEREMRLIRAKAYFYGAVRAAFDMKRDVPAATRYEAEIKRDFSPVLLESSGFKRLVPLGYQAYNEAVPLGVYHKEYTERVETVLGELIAADAKEDYDTNVNLRNIAEMTVRYDHQLDMIDSLVSAGENLVYIQPHVNCSPRCEKYQVGGSLHPSGLYSLDGSSGKTPDGIPFLPLTFATDNPQDRYTTRAGKTYQNGCITGFNCRHKLIPYRRGVKPIPIPAKAIEKRREIELTQREYEREIRYQKRLAVQTKGIDPRKYSEARKRALKLNATYKDFCKSNDIAYYPSRTKILDGEESFPIRESDKL
jgi:hypothetical protein